MSKITGITIISQVGTKSYFTGRTYNGLLLNKIIDNTIESERVYCPIFTGLCQDDQKVFEVINAPIELEYSIDPLEP